MKVKSRISRKGKVESRKGKVEKVEREKLKK